MAGRDVKIERICIGREEGDGKEKARICISLRLMGREESNELNALRKRGWSYSRTRHARRRDDSRTKIKSKLKNRGIDGKERKRLYTIISSSLLSLNLDGGSSDRDNYGRARGEDDSSDRGEERFEDKLVRAAVSNRLNARSQIYEFLDPRQGSDIGESLLGLSRQRKGREGESALKTKVEFPRRRGMLVIMQEQERWRDLISPVRLLQY